MRVPAIVLIGLLVVIAGGLHFLFFGPMSSQWQAYSHFLLDKRMEYLKIAGVAEDPTEIAVIARRVQEQNRQLRQKLSELGDRYELDRIPTTGADLEQEVLDRLRTLEVLETSAAKLTFDESSVDAETRVTILQNWGIGAGLGEESNGNRFFRATDEDVRVYAGGPSRISTASGAIDLMVRPRGWSGAEDNEDRTILYAVGTSDRPLNYRIPTSSIIRLTKTSQGRLELAMSNPDPQAPSLLRFADIRDWKDGEWHRVTVTWSNSPQDTELYIDGKRSSAFDARSRTSLSTRNLRSKTAGRQGYEDMMREMWGPAPGPFSSPPRRSLPLSRRTTAPSSLRVTYMRDKVPVPHAIDKIILGSAENEQQPANADIDELFILNRTVSEAELANPLQYSEDTLLYDNFQNAYGDVRLLESTLNEMRSSLQLIKTEEIQSELRQKKENEYQLLKRSIGLDEEEIEKQPPQTTYLVQVLTTDQIHRMVKDVYGLNELKKILRVPILEPGNENQEQALRSIISFLDLTLEVVKKAKEDKLAKLSEVIILGESYAASDKELTEQFKKKVEALAEELGISEMPAGPGGPMGLPPGAMMPSSYGGYPYGGFPPGMGYPPYMMTGYGMPDGMNYAEYQEKISQYRRYQKALRQDVIPPEIRAEFARAEQKEGFYTRRLMQLAVLGKIDYLSQFLYDIEFTDRLATIRTIGMERETADLIDCTLSVDFHHVSAEITKESETEGAPATET